MSLAATELKEREDGARSVVVLSAGRDRRSAAVIPSVAGGASKGCIIIFLFVLGLLKSRLVGASNPKKN